MTIQSFGQFNDGYHMGGSWGWSFIMMLGMIIAAIAIVVLVRAALQPSNFNNKGGNPLETVKQRYASGEINKAEYDQLCKDLK